MDMTKVYKQELKQLLRQRSKIMRDLHRFESSNQKQINRLRRECEKACERLIDQRGRSNVTVARHLDRINKRVAILNARLSA